MTRISDDVVEAGARAICRVRCPGAHPCDMEGTHCKPNKCSRHHIYTDDARACLTAAIRQWNAKGVVVAEVPAAYGPFEPTGWRMTTSERYGEAFRNGHNAAIAQTRANQITGGDDEG